MNNTIQLDSHRILATLISTIIASTIGLIFLHFDNIIPIPFIYALSFPFAHWNYIKNKFLHTLIIVLVIPIIFVIGLGMLFFLNQDNGQVKALITSATCSILVLFTINNYIKLQNIRLALIATIIFSSIAILLVEPLKHLFALIDWINDPGVVFFLWQVGVSLGISLGFEPKKSLQA